MTPIVIDQGLPRDSVTGALAVSGGGGSVDTSTLVIKGPDDSADNVIQPTGAAVVPVTIKGAASQSAHLLDLQDSAGAQLNAFAPDGTLYFSTDCWIRRHAGNSLRISSPGECDLEGTFVAGWGQNKCVRLSYGSWGDSMIEFGPGSSFDTTLKRTAAGVLSLVEAGGGLRLTSPDGLTQKTVTINNAGALTLL